MKRSSSWLASWALYCAGDAVSVVALRVDADALWQAYQALMRASHAVQRWGGSGPWVVEPTESEGGE